MRYLIILSLLKNRFSVWMVVGLFTVLLGLSGCASNVTELGSPSTGADGGQDDDQRSDDDQDQDNDDDQDDENGSGDHAERSGEVTTVPVDGATKVPVQGYIEIYLPSGILKDSINLGNNIELFDDFEGTEVALAKDFTAEVIDGAESSLVRLQPKQDVRLRYGLGNRGRPYRLELAGSLQDKSGVNYPAMTVHFETAGNQLKGILTEEALKIQRQRIQDSLDPWLLSYEGCSGGIACDGSRKVAEKAIDLWDTGKFPKTWVGEPPIDPRKDFYGSHCFPVQRYLFSLGHAYLIDQDDRYATYAKEILLDWTAKTDFSTPVDQRGSAKSYYAIQHDICEIGFAQGFIWTMRSDVWSANEIKTVRGWLLQWVNNYIKIYHEMYHGEYAVDAAKNCKTSTGETWKLKAESKKAGGNITSANLAAMGLTANGLDEPSLLDYIINGDDSQEDPPKTLADQIDSDISPFEIGPGGVGASNNQLTFFDNIREGGKDDNKPCRSDTGYSTGQGHGLGYAIYGLRWMAMAAHAILNGSGFNYFTWTSPNQKQLGPTLDNFIRHMLDGTTYWEFENPTLNAASLSMGEVSGVYSMLRTSEVVRLLTDGMPEDPPNYPQRAPFYDQYHYQLGSEINSVDITDPIGGDTPAKANHIVYYAGSTITTLTWSITSASKLDELPTVFEIKVDGVKVGSTTQPHFTLTNLSPGTQHTVIIVSKNFWDDTSQRQITIETAALP